MLSSILDQSASGTDDGQAPQKIRPPRGGRFPDGAWALLRLAPRDRGSPAPHSEAADNGARSRPHRARRAARRATGSAGHRRDAGEGDPLARYIQLRLCVFSGSISARENLAQDGVARKMAPNVLKRLNLGSEMVWPRTSRSHKMW